MIGFKDFDYYLWTDENGKNMVKIKATGEVTEVPAEVMRFLRCVEKREVRQKQQNTIKISTQDGTVMQEFPVTEVSLEYLDNEGAYRHLDIPSAINVERFVYTKMAIEQTVENLSPAQKQAFQACMYNGVSQREYAKEKEVYKSSVDKMIRSIRKKMKKNLD